MSAAPSLAVTEAAAIFDAISQPTRLEAYRLLLRYQPYGLAAGDVARLLDVPHNTMSTHLSLLQRVGLVSARREGRSILYAAEPERYATVEEFLKEGLPDGRRAPRRRSGAIIKRPAADAGKIYNVLILCTANSARSLIAEALINREGSGRFQAFSAGSRPRGKADPVAMRLLEGLGYDTAVLTSKSWHEFSSRGAPAMDFVITVCDTAAGEECPALPGHPLVTHWGIADPVGAPGSGDAKRVAMQLAYRQLVARVTAFVNLPVESMPLATLAKQLAEIGCMDGATEMTRALRAA